MITNLPSILPHRWSRRGRRLAWLRRISDLEPALRARNDAELGELALSLRYRARCREPLGELLPETYALVREAARRTLDQRPYDVQMLGAIALFDRCIVEMETGEGKTLTAAMPMALHALAGRGAHLATANDYLARRDAELLTPLYQLLRLEVGVIQSELEPQQRRQAYHCDVTYGTAKEFGFDLLRDRLQARAAADQAGDLLGQLQGRTSHQATRQAVQRGLEFLLVDEADNLLIDEARTPLVISAEPTAELESRAEAFRWSARVVDQFETDRDWDYDPRRRVVSLSAAGRAQVRALVKPSELDRMRSVDLYEHVERALKVARDFHRDRQYVLRDGEVVIVDESTGRLAEGRRWRDGIHQAIEAREQLEISLDTGQAAGITVQSLCGQYRKLAGMTGTAASARRELKSVYKLQFMRVPTHRPCRRAVLPAAVFAIAAEKWEAIVREVAQVHATGRPVLVGTTSIDRSQLLAQRLRAAGLQSELLNAHEHETEAAIVAAAGQRGRITVATNMAGRGTDIRLGPGVVELGGLHVIASELHDSARIDRQLAGRSARQGDPGTVRQFMSLEDDILRHAYGEVAAQRCIARGQRSSASLARFERLLRRAQRKVEHRHYRGRKTLAHHAHAREVRHRAMGQDPFLDGPG